MIEYEYFPEKVMKSIEVTMEDTKQFINDNYRQEFDYEIKRVADEQPGVKSKVYVTGIFQTDGKISESKYVILAKSKRTGYCKLPSNYPSHVVYLKNSLGINDKYLKEPRRKPEGCTDSFALKHFDEMLFGLVMLMSTDISMDRTFKSYIKARDNSIYRVENIFQKLIDIKNN